MNDQTNQTHDYQASGFFNQFITLHKEALTVVAIGFGIAVLAQMFFIGDYICWFLGSLTHEIGHAAFANFMGMPSFPVIRLDGHAAAVARPQVFVLLLVMLIAHGMFAWRMRDVRGWRWFFAALVFVHLFLGFCEGPRRIVHLYAGQCGEVLFAGIFLFRAWTGGFTEQPSERPLYASLAWVFILENFGLAWGLMFSRAARQEYMSNGSFGLTNDLIKVSQDLGISLQAAAFPLLCFALAVPIFVAIMSHSWLRYTKKI